MQKVYWNEKIVSAAKANIGIDDSSFLYGIGLFETMRAAVGRVLRLEDHLNRLIASAAALSIYNGYTVDTVKNAIDQVLEANKLTEARLRLTLTNGPQNNPEAPACNLLITAVELVPYPGEYYEKGVRVVVTDYRQNATDPFAGHKTTCYGARLTALRKAHEKLATEALWFTTENRLAEGCISNVFLVKDNSLLTPPTITPVLPGIARKTVLELAEELKIPLEERPLDVKDLLGANEVFLTNMIMTILPVTSIEAHTVGNGKPGPITRQLAEAFQQKFGL